MKVVVVIVVVVVQVGVVGAIIEVHICKSNLDSGDKCRRLGEKSRLKLIKHKMETRQT